MYPHHSIMENSDKHLHEEHRDRVIKMASQMFFEQGIRKVRMDDVAAALSMSKRTLYEMFSDKEELLLECMKVNQEEKIRFAMQVVAESENVLEIVLRLYMYGMENIKKIHPAMFQDLNKYPKVCAYLEIKKKEKIANNKAFYSTGIQQGIFREDVNFDIFQFLMDLSMNGFLNNRVLMEQWTLAEVLDTVMRVNMRGICTEKGQRILDDFFKENKI